ncbi:MAG: ABC transporter permease [Acidobacteriota bacterium]|nr:ABC transporter permease [Acidobacteriota bacterium]
MSFLEALRLALDSLAGHKLRSGLTMLGIVFGVGAVIAMLSIGAGAEAEALAMVERLGLNNVLVRAKVLDPDEAEELRRKSVGVSLRDAEAILDAVPGVQRVAPRAAIDVWSVVAEGAVTDAAVFGVGDGHAALAGLQVQEGRFLDPLDIRDHAQVGVIGPGVRQRLFGYGEAVGQLLKVNDVWLEVVGVLAPEGAESDSFQGVAVSSTADTVYVPVSTALRKFERDPVAAPLSELVVELAEPGAARTAARAIDTLLQRLHAGVDDYQLVVPEALLEQSRKTQRLFNLVMGCIAGISLLVGGIGIMNTLLATVLERTREIGVRRAVGARRRDVLTQFLAEAFALSAVGALAGILLGVIISRIIAASAGWPTVVTLGSILLAAGVAVAVGIASGLYPARRAAALDPIESLRYE